MRNLTILLIVTAVLLVGGAMEIGGLLIEVGYKFTGVAFTVIALTVLYWGWRHRTRIISARKATSNERTQYEEGIGRQTK